MTKINVLLSLLQGCNSMERLRKIQAQIFVNGYQDESSILNKLLNFCAVSASGDLIYAHLLFGKINNPQTPAWNSMIRGLSQSTYPMEAIFFYNKMIQDAKANADNFTFLFVLKACEKTKVEKKGREVHGSIVKYGYASDVTVGTNLVRTYVGNGLIRDAENVFHEMPVRDLVSWNSMISCYSQAGLHEIALKVYHKMKSLGLGLDEFTVVSLLSCCAHVGALNLGTELHKFAEGNRFLNNIFVCNALVDMYAKCGNMDEACRVFEGMRKRDLLSWNSMINALGIHGRGEEAIKYFNRMLIADIRPNPITFLGLLCGCSHQGLIDDGLKFFDIMSSKYNIKPGIKHYGCMVDLFGRAGKLENALEMIRNSSFGDDPVLWRTLLSSCKIHGNVEMGELAMDHLLISKVAHAGDHVLLAGIYHKAGDRQGVSRMRKLIKDRGIKTTPGWSWTEVNSVVHRFSVSDKFHRDSEKIYRMIEQANVRASAIGYVKCVEILESRGQEEKTEEYHSEKLAIAFGLVRTPEGSSIRIVKNLRVCRDCHQWTKFVSKAFDREIIVRDRIRFHHFKNGFCSCKDYW